MEKQKYPSINGLRALSIIMVLFHHLNMQNHILDNLVTLDWLSPLLFVLEDGHLGVNMFFVISGFLITSLLIQEEINTKSISIKKFYIRRILRIFPAYYFLLFVYFILQLFSIIQISTASWITSITYTKYLNSQLDWPTAHFWSLSLEEFFYFFWPLCFVMGAKVRKNIIISLLIIVPIIRISIDSAPSNLTNTLLVLSRIDAISIGCLFAIYKDTIIKRFSLHWTKLFYISILSLFLLRYVPFITDNTPFSFIFLALGLTHGTIANFLIALIMMYSVFGSRGAWFKILNLKVINYIGILSYSIYLWQQIFISGSDNWATKFPQNIIFIFIAAFLSYTFIEKPFLKLKSKFITLKR